MPVTSRLAGKCALCAFRAKRCAPRMGQRVVRQSTDSLPRPSLKESALASRDTGVLTPAAIPDIDSQGSHNGYRTTPISIPQSAHGRPGAPFNRKSGFIVNPIARKSQRKAQITLKQFDRLIDKQLDALLKQTAGKNATSSWGLENQDTVDRLVESFKKNLIRAWAHLPPHSDGWKKSIQNLNEIDLNDLRLSDRTLFTKLRLAYLEKGPTGLSDVLQYALQNHILESAMVGRNTKHQQEILDLRYPMEWYPATRAMQRTIHLHVGPTNSGKTYQALKRLEAAGSGIYAGPLRLLAHEVYTRLNAKGKNCALITGEERRIPDELSEGDFMRSCTVEMVPLNANVDVAVIDEIQMMGDPFRGWAWTQAFLGVLAKEVHLCGELRTVPLIRDLCAAMGEDLIVHEYERLSPLTPMKVSLKGNLNKLEKGDCMVLFSRVAIHQMKLEIQKRTGRRCAVVYGSLPPETRAQQAALFNDPNNEYDFLVASDAVGMGLNLSIKRMIFESTQKYNGFKFYQIPIPEVKQIAGRAGRYRTASQAIDKETISSPNTSEEKVGLVTTLEDFDMPYLRRAMATEVSPLATAGIYPPANILARFAATFPSGTPLSYMLVRLQEISPIHPRFHLCNTNDQLTIADLIHEFDMSMSDRLIFLQIPFNRTDVGIIPVVKAFAKCVADGSGGDICDIKELKLEVLDEVGTDKALLVKLEALHRALTIYLWLTYRFAGVFTNQPLAFHAKSLVEERIEECLGKVEILSFSVKQLQRRKRLQVAYEARQIQTRGLWDGQEAEADDLHPEDIVYDVPQLEERPVLIMKSDEAVL